MMNIWDPIGVGSVPEAADEYDSYVPIIYRMLVTRQTLDVLFDYLWWLETEHMGLIGDRQRTAAFARELLTLPSIIDGQDFETGTA